MHKKFLILGNDLLKIVDTESDLITKEHQTDESKLKTIMSKINILKSYINEEQIILEIDKLMKRTNSIQPKQILVKCNGEIKMIIGDNIVKPKSGIIKLKASDNAFENNDKLKTIKNSNLKKKKSDLKKKNLNLKKIAIFRKIENVIYVEKDDVYEFLKKFFEKTLFFICDVKSYKYRSFDPTLCYLIFRTQFELFILDIMGIEIEIDHEIIFNKAILSSNCASLFNMTGGLLTNQIICDYRIRPVTDEILRIIFNEIEDLVEEFQRIDEYEIDFNNDFNNYFNNDFNNDLKDDFNNDLKDEFNNDLKDEFNNDFNNNFDNDFNNDVNNDVKIKIINEIKKSNIPNFYIDDQQIDELIKLRKFIAKNNNESPEFVMTTKQLSQLFIHKPTDEDSFVDTISRSSPLVRAHLMDFLLIFKDNKETTISKVLGTISGSHINQIENENQSNFFNLPINNNDYHIINNNDNHIINTNYNHIINTNDNKSINTNANHNINFIDSNKQNIEGYKSSDNEKNKKVKIKKFNKIEIKKENKPEKIIQKEKNIQSKIEISDIKNEKFVAKNLQKSKLQNKISKINPKEDLFKENRYQSGSLIFKDNIKSNLNQSMTSQKKISKKLSKNKNVEQPLIRKETLISKETLINKKSRISKKPLISKKYLISKNKIVKNDDENPIPLKLKRKRNNNKSRRIHIFKDKKVSKDKI
ncbi:hypothetical protein DMUE_3063 [Dictyocoela muelleri]|nr:hypothetical protein DMUE_3063 [Dictyocoela muelleri]